MRTRSGRGRVDPLPSGTVTFLFTDIEGSTTLLQELGDNAYESTLADHRRLLRKSFEAHGGYEIGTEGDSFFVAFENADDALRATLDAQLALESHTWAHRPLRVRMGLHTGEARVAEQDYIGIAVHQAARISSAAHGGQVLVSQSTRDRVGSALPDDSRWVDLGEHRLKDLAEPVRLFNLAHPRLRAEVPPPRTLTVLPNNLPVQLTSFIGRAKDIVDVRELLGTDRLVTLVGAGGAGKTRLALQVGAEVSTWFANGVWFVELAPLSDPDLVMREVAEALGLRADESRSIDDVLLDHARDRELLIVLDNCEHLAESAARVAERLLKASVGLRVLATSREPLGARGERVYRVPSLDVPTRATETDVLEASDAVRLFCDRAAHSSAGFMLSERNAPQVAEICRRLDGLPLAIELAAARVRMFTPDEIAKRLDQRFSILTGGTRTGLRRQQTLRATVDWSYELLSEQEQLLFRRLSVFAGGFTIEAAEAICSGGGIDDLHVVDLLSSLIDRSLVGVDTRTSTTRYRLLETMREYGRELLAASGEASDVWSKHLAWYADLGAEASDGLEGPHEIAWLERLDDELDNIRQALSWSSSGGNAADGVRLAAKLDSYWDRRAYVAEAAGWLRSTMAAAGELPVPLRAEALAVLGGLVMALEGIVAGRSLAQECVGLPREPDAIRYIAVGMSLLAHISLSEGDVHSAIANGEEALDLMRQSGYRCGEADALNVLAQLLTWTGDDERMRSSSERSLEIYREIGLRSRIIYGLSMQSIVAYRAGDLDEVERIANEELELSRALGDEQRLAGAFWELGRVARDRARFAESIGWFEEALRIYRESEANSWLSDCLRDLALTLWVVGDADHSASCLEEASRAWTWTGAKGAISDLSIAMLKLMEGDADAARDITSSSLDVLRAAGANEAVALIGLAESHRVLGEHDQARTHAELALQAARTGATFSMCTAALQTLAKAELEAGDAQAADVLLMEALERSSSKGFVRDTGIALELLGWHAVAAGQAERSARLLGAAENIRDTYGFALGVDSDGHERAVSGLCAALGENAYPEPWEQGRALSMDDAIALATASG